MHTGGGVVEVGKIKFVLFSHNNHFFGLFILIYVAGIL